MKLLKKTSIYFIIVIIFLGFTQCKSQKAVQKAPFTITEKTYFYWVGGKKGSTGVNIKIVGNFDTTNLAFSSIYFQNREYKVVPEFRDKKFILIGRYETLNKKDIIMHQNPAQEFGNEPPMTEKKIPFDLQNDEAIIVYSINGKDFYYKVNGIKQLDTVYYP